MSEETTGTSEAHVEPSFPPPWLTSVSPYSGKTGTVVTLYGRGLASVTKATFTVNGVSKDGSVYDKADSSIKTTVPSGLDDNNGSVTVTNPTATSNSVEFAVLPS